jgi:hypothetical protein
MNYKNRMNKKMSQEKKKDHYCVGSRKSIILYIWCSFCTRNHARIAGQPKSGRKDEGDIICSMFNVQYLYYSRNPARIASKHRSGRKDEGDICSMFNALV